MEATPQVRETEPRLHLGEEIRAAFGEVIGDSAALKTALALVSMVAPADSSVLIMGETGTGKELVARAIHNLSRRRERAFVKLNCAAMDGDLSETDEESMQDQRCDEASTKLSEKSTAGSGHIGPSSRSLFSTLKGCEESL